MFLSFYSGVFGVRCSVTLLCSFHLEAFWLLGYPYTHRRMHCAYMSYLLRSRYSLIVLIRLSLQVYRSKLRTTSVLSSTLSIAKQHLEDLATRVPGTIDSAVVQESLTILPSVRHLKTAVESIPDPASGLGDLQVFAPPSAIKRHTTNHQTALTSGQLF
jgi:hypothetical protein